MPKFLTTLLVGFLTAGVAAAQATASPAAAGSTAASPQVQTSQPTATPSATSTAVAPPAAGSTRIAAGSVIPVTLTKTVDAKKAKTGDEVVAKVTQDMKSSSGEMLLAKDTKVVGHITEAQAHSKEQKESQLAIAFDHAVMKDGTAMQMPMSIQAIIGEQPNQANGGGGNEAAPSSRSAGPATSGTARSGMSSSSSPAATSTAADATPVPGDSQSAKNSRPEITADTKGVIGISNLNLNAPADAAQGSVLTSDKNNVKLESGTMMLLKVSR
jgi:hypothetical protein